VRCTCGARGEAALTARPSRGARLSDQPPTSQLVYRCLRSIAQCLLDAEPRLTAADTQVGDGDCGHTFREGATVILELLQDPAALRTGLGPWALGRAGGAAKADDGARVYAQGCRCRTRRLPCHTWRVGWRRGWAGRRGCCTRSFWRPRPIACGPSWTVRPHRQCSGRVPLSAACSRWGRSAALSGATARCWTHSCRHSTLSRPPSPSRPAMSAYVHPRCPCACKVGTRLMAPAFYHLLWGLSHHDGDDATQVRTQGARPNHQGAALTMGGGLGWGVHRVAGGAGARGAGGARWLPRDDAHGGAGGAVVLSTGGAAARGGRPRRHRCSHVAAGAARSLEPRRSPSPVVSVSPFALCTTRP
jgi:hypothetical protein